MPARSKARKRALDILFEAEIRGEPVLDLLAERSAAERSPTAPRRSPATPPSWSGACRRTGSASTNCWPGTPRAGRWTGCPPWTGTSCGSGRTSCSGRPGCPDGVAISEAVLLARELSTDGSPAFVNGLLARLLELRPELEPAADDRPAPRASPDCRRPAVHWRHGDGMRGRRWRTDVPGASPAGRSRTTRAATSCTSTWTRSTPAWRSGTGPELAGRPVIVGGTERARRGAVGDLRGARVRGALGDAHGAGGAALPAGRGHPAQAQPVRRGVAGGHGGIPGDNAGGGAAGAG